MEPTKEEVKAITSRLSKCGTAGNTQILAWLAEVAQSNGGVTPGRPLQCNALRFSCSDIGSPMPTSCAKITLKDATAICYLPTSRPLRAKTHRAAHIASRSDRCNEEHGGHHIIEADHRIIVLWCVPPLIGRLARAARGCFRVHTPPHPVPEILFSVADDGALRLFVLPTASPTLSPTFLGPVRGDTWFSIAPGFVS